MSAEVGQASRATSPKRYWLYGLLLGVLAYICVTRLLPSGKQAMLRHGRASFLVHSIAQALQRYADEHQGEYPADLAAVFAARADGSSYFGSFEPAQVDPWHRPFLYEPPSAAGARPRVRSLGADGELGGEGEDADIDSDKFPR
jgi:general secretion pathway protein G